MDNKRENEQPHFFFLETRKYTYDLKQQQNVH